MERVEPVEPVEILESLEPVEPLGPTEPVEPFNPWNPWKTTSGFAERIPAPQATVALLNVPLRINHHPFILFLSLCPRSSFHLVSLQLFSLHLVSLHLGSHRFVAFRFVPHYPFTLFPLSLSPILLRPNILSHHHHFSLSPIIPSSCLSSLCTSSFCAILCPIILSPIIPASPTTNRKLLGWISGSREVQRLTSPSLCLPSPWSGLLDLSPFILFPFILPPIVLSPHHPFMLSRCILFPFWCLPSMRLSSLPFISFRYLFILPTITPSSCLRSRCLALFFPRYVFILSLIIPSSCLSLTLHLILSSCPCQCFLTMRCVWSKVFWLLLLLGCKAGYIGFETEKQKQKKFWNRKTTPAVASRFLAKSFRLIWR